MGYLRPTALIVTGLYEEKESGAHWADVARGKALELFDREWGPMAEFRMADLVSPVSSVTWNNTRSFAVHWDGSSEGFVASSRADEARAEFVQWLRAQAYEDGSSPLRWVEVAYCDDDGTTMVLATSMDQRNAARARENLIRLEIDDPLRSAFEWAALDGIVIRDPDGWRDGVDELGPVALEMPIGRGEYERRLEVSTVVSLGAGR